MKTETKIERSWLLIFFGLCFAIPALLFLTKGVMSSFYESSQMQSWQPIQATLLHAETKYSYSSDANTYQAKARYRYQVNGQQFENARVSIHSGSDNVGEYQREMGRTLINLYNAGKKVTAFYNPENPQDSIIDRNVRWGMIGFQSIFVLVFGLVGGAVTYFGWRGKKIIISTEATEKPWLSRPEWITNKIYSNNKTDIYVIGFFTVLWNVMSWPAVALQIEKTYRMEGLGVTLIMAMFPAIGLILIFMLTRMILQRKKFGKTPLSLDPFPGSIGGQVGGKIAVNKECTPHVKYKVSLVCVKQYYTRSGGSQEMREKLVWQKESFAKYFFSGSNGELAFSFDVPADLPSSSVEDDGQAKHIWRLHLESSQIKLSRTFEIPVFVSDKIQISSVKAAVPEYVQAHENKQKLNQFLPTDGGRIHYPMFYKPGNKFFFLFVGVFFAAIIGFLWSEMPVFMAIIFLSVSALMIVFSVYLLFKSLTVVLDGSYLKVTHCFMGFFPRHQKVPYGEISGFKEKEVLRSQSGNKHTVYYSLFAVTHSGQELKIAQQIEGQNAVDLIEEHFREKMGLAVR